MKEVYASDSLIERLNLYTKLEQAPYNRILACLFEMYESKLDSTIAKVKVGALQQNEILLSLAEFKKALTNNCEALIDDIWNNYKFYAN